jgi:SpoVK/Ycf46/Vps4 family AAA+-type ATPase
MEPLKTKATPTRITEKKYRAPALRTQGFSGADIETLCKAAAMEMVGKLQQAEYFLEYQGILWPCNAGEPACFRATLLELTPCQLAMLRPSDLCFAAFKAAFRTRFEQRAVDFGEGEKGPVQSS